MRYDIFDPDLREKEKKGSELIEGEDGQPYKYDGYSFELNIFLLKNGDYAFGVRFFNEHESSITNLYNTRGNAFNEAIQKVKDKMRKRV